MAYTRKPKMMRAKNPQTRIFNKPVSATVIFVMGAIFSQAIMPMTAVAADPQFNIFSPYSHTQQAGHDYYMLDVRNETDGSPWNSSTNADPGDILTFYFYYHNGINNTTALNTTLQIDLPTEKGYQHTVTSHLWADNTSNATEYSPLTQSVTVSLSSIQGLDYIAGSAKWFPNQSDWRSAAPTAFPYGQTGEDLFTDGINIGSIQGCWEFSGAIVFQARATNLTPTEGELDIEKTMRNLTNGETSYSHDINASPREEVAALIKVTNTGDDDIHNVVVDDDMPDRLIYKDGSTRVDNAYSSQDIVDGINIGTLTPGEEVTIYFEAVLEREVLFPRGVVTLTNTAIAHGDGVDPVEDYADITISYFGCHDQIESPPYR